jgi:hypothetical protein
MSRNKLYNYEFFEQESILTVQEAITAATAPSPEVDRQLAAAPSPEVNIKMLDAYGSRVEENLINMVNVNFSMSGGGNVEWVVENSSLFWDGVITVLALKKNTFNINGFYDITMPLKNEKITYFDSSDAQTTIRVTEDGINLKKGDALFYKLPADNIIGSFIVINYKNNLWTPDRTCVLLAIRNFNDGIVKYLPAGINFSNNETTTFNTVKNEWTNKKNSVLKTQKIILVNNNGKKFWSLSVGSRTDGSFILEEVDELGNQITGAKKYIYNTKK